MIWKVHVFYECWGALWLEQFSFKAREGCMCNLCMLTGLRASSLALQGSLNLLHPCVSEAFCYADQVRLDAFAVQSFIKKARARSKIEAGIRWSADSIGRRDKIQRSQTRTESDAPASDQKSGDSECGNVSAMLSVCAHGNWSLWQGVCWIVLAMLNQCKCFWDLGAGAGMTL